MVGNPKMEIKTPAGKNCWVGEFHRPGAQIPCLNKGKCMFLINKSKLFAGLAMLMLNIGSKYIVIELSPNQESYFRNNIARQLLIFSIAWVGTRDILTSIFITAAFTILTQFLFNEKSKLCILPKSLKKFKSILDTNNDGVVSKKEIDA